MKSISLGIFDPNHRAMQYLAHGLKHAGYCINFRLADFSQAKKEEILSSDVVLVCVSEKPKFYSALVSDIKKIKSEVKLVAFTHSLILDNISASAFFKLGMDVVIPLSYSHEDLMHQIDLCVDKLNFTNIHHFNFEQSVPQLIKNKINDEFDPLNKQALAIIKYKSEGKTAQEIGESIFRSRRTVEVVLQNLYEKYECHNFNQLYSILNICEK